MNRTIATTISSNWTVYRIWPEPQLDHLADQKPWLAVSPGHSFVKPHETHQEALDYAASEAAKPDEVCS